MYIIIPNILITGGKTRVASEGVEYDFYFTEYDFVLCDHVFWFLPIVWSN
jgi:hypothetical protein